MRIGKYEFPDAETFEALASKVNAEVNTVAELGFLTEMYHVDVLWRFREHEGWEPFRVEVSVSSHEFLGYPYEQYKIQDDE